jgi:hypothetical protein
MIVQRRMSICRLATFEIPLRSSWPSVPLRRREEGYSSSISPFIDYDLDAEGRMTVHNTTVHLYQFFDATAHAEYLYQCIEETIRRDLQEEIGFLVVFDAAVRKVLEIIDMANRRASLLVRLILQNKGKLSNAKRDSFAEISEDELHRIEGMVWSTWQKGRETSGVPLEPEV